MSHVNMSDAARRAAVELPDGSVGVLFAVNQRTKKSKIRLGGRWVIVQTSSLRRVVIHLAGEGERFSCCGKTAVAIKHRFTTTTEPRLTTCRYFVGNSRNPDIGTNTAPNSPKSLSGQPRGLSEPLRVPLLAPKRKIEPTEQSARPMPTNSNERTEHENCS